MMLNSQSFCIKGGAIYLCSVNAKIWVLLLVCVDGVVCLVGWICRGLRCEAEAGGDPGHRPVPRRLSGPVPRGPEDGKRIQSVSEEGSVLRRLLLRLCEYEDGSGACDDRDRSLHGWAWDRGERVVGCNAEHGQGDL